MRVKRVECAYCEAIVARCAPSSPSSLSLRSSYAGHASPLGRRMAAPCVARKGEAWWAVTDSNRRHSACKADALPTELTAPTMARFIASVRQRASLP